jgi:hypothetical protein
MIPLAVRSKTNGNIACIKQHSAPVNIRPEKAAAEAICCK